MFIVCCLAGCGEAKHSAAAPPRRPSVPLQKDFSMDLGAGVSMEFVLIPSGEFIMGSNNGGNDERPPHKVTIAKPFYLGKYEVTQKQWQTLMGDNPSHHKGDNKPVEWIRWYDCDRFMTELKRVAPGNQFRLPTEAEWEYACRAGTTNERHCADTELGEYAWYEKNSDSMTHPVGQKKPNAWGLHDMHGNVLDWCQDFYVPNYDGAPADGTARPKGAEGNRVLRGGSYDSPTNKVRSTYRCWGYPPVRHKIIGFRVLLETP